MAKIIFVLGGVRSGKSVFAEKIAIQYNDVTYIATAEAKDEEMEERIRIHKRRRPDHWKTVESPLYIDRIVSGLKNFDGLVFIDCMTLYVTNMLFHKEPDLLFPGNEIKGRKQREKLILSNIKTLCHVCRESCADVIIVSNEVGLGVMPDNTLSREYLDIAGRANQIIAADADEVFFIVAGISQRIK
ncbi:MAG: bifunctional adenosylcobinamide kinase/adenosylcobinamide-phosphate guanylyltransferase [Candidatus Brocadiaceae bacterium]|nr:bifunctional adenosylcobinamide kinase/adenosylcobinamide-phosphate guanylyltransferase [Candidatus Brocadiaceae bacterium]